MPTVRASRTIAAPAAELWELVCDPYHLPRWWPRVTRVEQVDEDGFTEVMKTRKGKTVRADFAISERDGEQRRLRWQQRIEGTPFAGVLQSSETELTLRELAGGGRTLTEVTIELRQELSAGVDPAWAKLPGSRLARAVKPAGVAARMVRRAATGTIEEALSGLERISV